MIINYKNAMFLVRLNTHGRARQMARRRKTTRLLVGLLGSPKLGPDVEFVISILAGTTH